MPDQNNSKTPESSIGNTFSSAEYFQSLEKWVRNTASWQQLQCNSWQYWLMNQSTIHLPTSPITSINAVLNNSSAEIRMRGIECRLPPLWKRLVAEFIDFLCLLIVKLIATLILVDILDIVDWNKFDFDNLVQKTWRLDYSAAMELTGEFMVIEIAHKITACLFETMWLYRGYRGMIGGATPGKKLMHLRVVYSKKITVVRQYPEVIVLVEPGIDLGFSKAFIRSIGKTLMQTLFPFTFLFIYYQHNRCGYDVIAHTIVVEDPLRYHMNINNS